MKIKMSSWHYKWIANRWDEEPQSLCWYFWKIVISIFLMFCGAVTIAVTVPFIISIITIPFWSWFFPGFYIATAFSVLSFLIWVAAGITASYMYRTYLYESGLLIRSLPKEPGLVAQYLHAKHRKICPLLDYVRDE